MPGPASTVSEWCTSLKEHDEEMRWLAELFPLEELVDGSIPDEFADSVLGEWRAAYPNDARALRYLAVFRGDILLMKKASEMGDAWMMAEGFFHASRSDEEQFQLARASAEKRGCGWD